MKDDQFDLFYYHSDMRLPEKIKKIYQEARQEGKGSSLSVLVMKDKDGNKYEISSQRDRETALQNYQKKFSWLDLEFLRRGFLRK